MFVLGTCKKCFGTSIFDVGLMTEKEAKEAMSRIDFGECHALNGGWHVEIGSMADYWVLDWSKLSLTKEDLR